MKRERQAERLARHFCNGHKSNRLTALKTISARIRGSKTDLEELGEDTKDLADGFSKYAKELKAITGVDIMVEGTTNQFKDLYDIMNEIARVWGTLTDTQQARTAEILGGTRQLQVIASIISNWKDAQNALVTAQESAGAAARANNIYMDTTTAHLNQFKSAFQDLSHTIVDSDLLKSVVDFGTALLNAGNAITKFIKSAGGLIPILTTVAGLLLVFKPALFASALSAIGTAAVGIIGSITSAFSTMKITGLGVVTTLDMVKAGATSTGTAVASTAGAFGLALVAASALVAVITKVKNAQAEAREESIRLGEAAATEGDELVDLVDKYMELAQVSSDNGEVLEARDEIISRLGLERSEVEELIREYGNYEEAIRHATTEQLKSKQNTLTGALNASRENLTTESFGRYQDVRRVSWGNDNAQGNLDAIAALQKAGYVKGASNTAKSGTFAYDFGDISSYEDVLNAYQQLHSMMQLLVDDGNANTAVYQDIYDLYTQMEPAVSAYNTALQNLLTNELQQNYLNSQIPQTAAEYYNLRNQLIETVMSSKEFSGSMAEATDVVDNFLSQQNGLDRFSDNIQGVFSNISSGADALNSVHEAFKSVKEVVDDVTNSLQAVNSVQDLIADGFVVDTQKAMELAAAYPSILDNATITAEGQLQLNEATVNSFIEGKEQEINSSIDAKIEELKADAAVLEAKKAFAVGQLQMAESVAKGEDAITVAQLKNRIDNSNKVVNALIQMGYDEATAYQMALQQMSDNTDIFDGNVGDAAESIAANFDSASESSASSLDANTQLMNTNINKVVMHAHEAAKAVRGIGSGNEAGNVYDDGGAGSAHVNNFNKAVNKKALVNAELRASNRTNVDLQNLISNIKADISGYTSAIGAINGQISALESLRNSALSGIKNYKPSSSGGSSGGGGGGGGGSGSDSSKKEETWFEKQYKLHQHYVNMDKETTADFLKWLDKAYKQAYNEGIITLDEFYKYEEEVYNGFNQIKEAAKSTFDALVEYRVKMLKQQQEDQKDSLKKQLDDLKDFYDKQKEMLQKQQDETKYIKEQNEKRQAVDDIRSQLAQLQFDNSAWAQKRRQELLEELSKAEEDLQEFEDERALEQALNALDDTYKAEEEKLNKEIDAIDELINDPNTLYNQALKDIKGNTEDLFKAFLLFNRKYGDGDDATIIKMWEEAFKNSEAFKSIFGSYYNDAKIGNYTGYKIPTGAGSQVGNGNGNSAGAGNNNGGGNSNQSSNASAPSLSSGSTVQVKPSATHFSPKSGGVRMASFVPGGRYTVYQTSGNEVLIGRDGVYTGWIYKSDIVGYKKGTKSATPGLHRINEEGNEAIFKSGDGNTYRMFSGGEKVLNAKATNFLYDFAMAGAEILDKMKGAASDTFRNIGTVNQPIDISMGDIIINGNTDQQTVSDIRRAQREQINDVLKAFSRYNGVLYRNAH